MITIIDYQMGNLRSVQKAIEKVGRTGPHFERRRGHRLRRKSHFAGCRGVSRCDARTADPRTRRADSEGAVASGKPFLGICLGLQLLFDKSYEDGEYEGLGILPGEVVRFDIPRFAAEPPLKVPHMGWNQVAVVTPEAPLLAGIEPGSHFYFVHSYYVRPEDESVVALTADYPTPFCAAIRRDNLFATQFHPEKSQAAGLRLLDNFVRL
jgi:glutamine amidotransferase